MKLLIQRAILASLVCGACSSTGCRAPGEEGVSPSPSSGPTVVTLDSASPLLSIKCMVKVGSTSDPGGKEGLANLVAQALLQGGFGDPSSPVTKEQLARIAQPWGDDALPYAQVSACTTTFHMTVPEEVLPQYIEKVLAPMLKSPLFLEDEIERLKKETAATIPALRYESLEGLGLAAFDEYVQEGTRYEHQPFGTEESLPALSRADVVKFHQAHYYPGNVILGVSRSSPKVVESIRRVVESMPSSASAGAGTRPRLEAAGFKGLRAVVIEEPNAPAASVHAGFPIGVTRTHPDFWPLHVANTWFGTHRDGFGRLYQAIREERGYNYGDYSYIEYWAGRTGSLFPIFNQPRKEQYFSIWVRPVQHEYARHMLKAVAYELDRLVREGLTEEQVEASKTKARTLYLNLGETVDRLLAARIDSEFHGQSPGYLDAYLERIESVTAEQVNAAIRKHLQAKDLKCLVVTDSKHARALVEELKRGGPAHGKGLQEYQLEKVQLSDGKAAWQIPEERIETLRLDALWAHHPMDFTEVELVPVTSIFKSGKFSAARKAPEGR